MAAVLQFRSDAVRRSRRPPRNAAPTGTAECEIVIFPGVRRERHATSPASSIAPRQDADHPDRPR